MVYPDGDDQLISQFVQTRDPAVRETLILKHVPLVHFVLGRLGVSRAQVQDYEDASSQGIMGLIEAVDHFDLSYGTRFSTYATLRIRGRVLDHLRSLDWLSRTARQRAKSVQEATNVLWSQLGRAPSEDELATYLKVDIDSLQQALTDMNQVIVSLDILVDTTGEGEASLYEALPDDSQEDPDVAVDENDLKNRLLSAIKTLSEREQMVLSLYYFDELTFKEIGAVLDVSESRVCQIHAKAIGSLRAGVNQVQSGHRLSLPQRRAAYESPAYRFD